jgi:hypothetical protein
MAPRSGGGACRNPRCLSWATGSGLLVVVVDLGGELDIVSAEMAVSYVSSVIDRYRRPAEPVTPRRGSLSRWLAMAGGARRSAQGRGR